MNTFYGLTLLFSLFGIVIWGFIFTKLKFYRWSIFAVLFYLFHVIAFYAVFFFFRYSFTNIFWNNWSAIIRLHALFYIIGAGIIVLYEWKQKNVR